MEKTKKAESFPEFAIFLAMGARVPSRSPKQPRFLSLSLLGLSLGKNVKRIGRWKGREKES